MKTHTSRTLIDRGRGLRFTESPRWHDGKLWFLDIHDKRIKTTDLGGRLETAVELPFIPNAFGFGREGDEIVERVELDTEGYAVMLGGPQRRHLFISGSDSHDPAEIARAPSATLRVVDVDVPGAGLP